jgi:hypothetical protein
MTAIPTSPAGPFADAALQWLLMRPRGEDLEAEAKGRRHIYAVDSNVMRFIGSPAVYAQTRRASSGGRYLLGLGHVFETDAPDLRTSIARGLSSFLAEGKLSQGMPLLLIPPIHLEVEAQMLALSSEDIKPHRAQNAETRKAIKVLSDRLKDKGLSVEDVENLAPEMQALIFESIGPPEEVRRMARLLVSNKVQPVGSARLPLEVAEILRPAGFIARFSYAERRDGKRVFRPEVDHPLEKGWVRRLDEYGRWSEQHLRNNDAEVLSRLEVWNKAFVNLEKQSNGQKNWRILYVTSDHRLFDAADNYRPEWTQSSFSRSFLRHPRAYLAEDGVLDTSSADPDITSRKMIEWLRILIEPDPNDDAPLDFRTLREDWFVSGRVPRPLVMIAERFKGVTNDPALKITEEWSAFTRQTVTINPPTEFDLPALPTHARDGVELLALIKDTFFARIAEERRRSLNMYMGSITQLRLEVDFRAPDRLRARNVVPIFFERWEKAENFIREVGRWGASSFNKEEYDRGLEEVATDDRTGYAFYLAHAALFAGNGRWRNAALLANRALEIADRLPPEERKGAEGREAAYFEAVCRRHSARRIADLSQCDPLLNQALQAHARELKSFPSLDVAAERFEAEKLALELTRILFHRFVDQDSTDMADGSAVLALANKIQELYEVVVVRIAATRDEPRTPHRSVHDTLKELRTRLLLNLISLGLLDLPRSRTQDIARNSLIELDSLAKDRTNPSFNLSSKNENSRVSLFGLLTVNYARMRSAFGGPQFRELGDAIEKRLATLNAGDSSVFPYDRARFEEMERVSKTPWP